MELKAFAITSDDVKYPTTHILPKVNRNWLVFSASCPENQRAADAEKRHGFTSI